MGGTSTDVSRFAGHVEQACCVHADVPTPPLCEVDLKKMTRVKEELCAFALLECLGW